jgi:hypothetical protein
MRDRIKEIFMMRKNLQKTIKNNSRTENGYVTYIVLDRFGFFKVGRTKDFDSRIRQITTANPHVVTFKVINYDCENEIHEMLSNCRYKNEWFEFLTDYKEIKNPVFDFMDYTYFNILLFISMINKHGIQKAKQYFSEIMLNRFKHIYCKF